MKNKFFAFTLAEVLITLGIIGVVAAMTIPTLVSNYQKREYVSQLQKGYATFTNGIKLMLASETDSYITQSKFWRDLTVTDGTASGSSILNSINNNLSKYFKISEACYGENKSDCAMYDVDYAKLSGEIDAENVQSNFTGIPYIQLEDGSVFYLICQDTEASSNSAGIMFFIDVNGPKGPNQYGRDMFDNFVIYDSKVGVKSGTYLDYIVYLHSIGVLEEDIKGYADAGDPKDTCGTIGDPDVSDTTGTLCYDRIKLEGWKMTY